MTIKELSVGDSLDIFGVFKNPLIKIFPDKTSLFGVLSDTSGEILLRQWHYNEAVTPADAGRIVKVRGKVTEYKGSLQLEVEKIRLTTAADQVDKDMIVLTAPIDVEEEEKEVIRILESIQDVEYRDFCLDVFNIYREDMLKVPAGKAVHHAFRHGLLMHTGNMLRMADLAANIYSGLMVNRSLLLAGTFLHDIGKLYEYDFAEDSGLMKSFNPSGLLLGHLVMGADLVKDMADESGIIQGEKVLLLQHMLLSHHGTKDWGAAVLPSTVEAFILSMLDNMDAKVETFYEVQKKLEPHTMTTEKPYGLEAKVYRHME